MRSTDELAAAWCDAIARLCQVTEKGWHAAHGDALALVSGAPAPSLNVAISTVTDPGPASLKALDQAAAQVGRSGLPWVVMVRGAASDAVVALADRHGLTERGDLPLMAVAAADAALPAAVLPDAGVPDAQIHPVRAADQAAYSGAIAAGFGVPEAIFGALMGGQVLDAPGFTGYLASDGGPAVATGFGVQGDGVVGVFNISVVPSARSRGLGRAMSARVLADGFAAGADTAYLHPSAEGRALYDSLGFRVVETWTTFTAG